jgi:hypothetical protein
LPTPLSGPSAFERSEETLRRRKRQAVHRKSSKESQDCVGKGSGANGDTVRTSLTVLPRVNRLHRVCSAEITMSEAALETQPKCGIVVPKSEGHLN